MKLNVKMIAQTAIGLIGFGIWSFAAYKYPATYLATYMTFVIGAVMTVVGVVLRDMKPPSDSPAQPKEPTP